MNKNTGNNKLADARHELLGDASATSADTHTHTHAFAAPGRMLLRPMVTEARIGAIRGRST
eukprot:7414693-Alexandrium_andersonii.AAC.1